MPRARRFVPLALVVAVLLPVGVAACGKGAGTGPKVGVPAAHGTADVAYAGSLVDLEEKVIGPAFTAATGYAYSGRGAGSLALSQEIVSGEISPSVFLSVGAMPIESLEPRFTTWYVQFAASPVVLAYSPSSRFAPQLEAIAAGREPLKDLFSLMATPGFRLGRTDPNVDPQGQAFVEMLQLSKAKFGLASGLVERILGGSPASASSPEIFDETALEPRLEAGQLDAASAFLSQAVQLHLHYIDLGPAVDLGDPALAADYGKASFPLANGAVVHGQPLVIDITVIGTASTGPADAFVAYTLSAAGRRAFGQNGYHLLPATAFGATSAVPRAVAAELAS